MNRYYISFPHKHTRKEPQTFRWYQWLMAAALCLMSMNFQGRFFYVVYIAFVVLLVLQSRVIRLSKILLPTLLFSLSLCLFSPETTISAKGLAKPFSYLICVFLGYNMIDARDVRIREKQVQATIVTLALGAYIHYLLNMLLNHGHIGARNLVDVWSGSILAATGHAAFSCLMIGASAALLFEAEKKPAKLFYFILLVSIVYYNLMLAGRTVFVLIACTLLVGFCYHFVNTKRIENKTRFLLSVVILAALAIWAFDQNWFGIQTVFRESNLFSRFFHSSASQGVLEDGRIAYKMQFLPLMPRYLWGGLHILEIVGHHAHDILLDTYDEAGIFALLAILMILIDNAVKTVRICRSPKILQKYKNLVLCMLVVTMLEFMVEPILAGMPWLLASFCVMYGAVSRLAEVS